MIADEEQKSDLSAVKTVEQTTEAHAQTLNRLKGSRVAIESFLGRYADSQSSRINALQGIEWLDRIVGEAAMGNFDSDEIESWMSQYRELAESSTLSSIDRKRISSLLLELQMKSDADTDAEFNSKSENKDKSGSEAEGARALRQRFETWKERSSSKSVNQAPESSTDSTQNPERTPEQTKRVRTAPPSPRKKIVLRRSGETKESGLFEKFTEQVWTELDLLYQEFETGDHALTKLNQILDYAEAKSDPMYLHLAGSLIYFLKIEGFRMAPYAERLRKAEKRFKEKS